MKKLIFITLIFFPFVASASWYLPWTWNDPFIGDVRVLTVPQGGTGAATFTVGECLKGNGTSAFTTGTCGTGSGGGADFPSVLTWGNATSTRLGFLNGFLSTASSTIDGNLRITGNSTTTNATTTTNLFGGLFTGNTLSVGQTATTSIYSDGTVALQDATYLQWGTNGNNSFRFFSGTLTVSVGGAGRLGIHSDGIKAITLGAPPQALNSVVGIAGNLAIGSSYFNGVAAPTSGLLVEGNVGIKTQSPATALDVFGTASSTNLFVQNNATATNATTTNLFSTNASSTNIWTALGACDTIDTDSTGKLTCGTDSVGVGADWSWTVATTYGTSTNSTTTPTWFRTALYASSTPNFPSVIDSLFSLRSTTTQATTTSFFSTNASTTNLSVGNSISILNSGTQTTLNGLCIALTGSSGLCDSNDASGGGGTFGKTLELVSGGDFLSATSSPFKSFVVGATTTSSLSKSALFQVNATGTTGTLIKASSTAGFEGAYLDFTNSAGASVFNIDSTGSLVSGVGPSFITDSDVPGDSQDFQFFNNAGSFGEILIDEGATLFTIQDFTRGSDFILRAYNGTTLFKSATANSYLINDYSGVVSSDKTVTWANLSGVPSLGSYITGFTSGHVPFGSSGLLATSSALIFDSSLNKLTVTNASTTLLSTSYASSTLWYGGGLLSTCASGSFLTWTGGVFGCDTDDNTGGSFPFTTGSNYGTTTNGTTTALQLINLFASSTINLPSVINNLITSNSTSTNATTTNLNVSSLFSLDGEYFDSLTDDATLANNGGDLQVVDVTCTGCFGTTEIAGLDISDDTNLAATWPVTLTGDTLSWSGLATTSNPTAGNLFYSNGTNGLVPVATSSLTINSPLTTAGTPGYLVGGSGFTVDIDDIKAVDLDLTDITLNDFTNDVGFITWPWTTATTYGTSTNSSTTPSWFRTAFYASSTRAFPSVIDSVTSTYSTSTHATSTTLFTTVASTTNFFGAGLQTCTSNFVLTWTGGQFGCEADDQGGGASDEKWATSTNGSFIYNNGLAFGRVAVGTSTGVTSLTTLTVSATSTVTEKLISFKDDTDSEVASLTDEGNLFASSSAMFNSDSTGNVFRLFENSGGEYYDVDVDSNGNLEFWNDAGAQVVEVSDIAVTSGSLTNILQLASFAGRTTGGASNAGTGIDFETTSSMGIHTNSTERIRINSSGSTGFGTSTPQWKLQIASSTGPQLTLSETDNSFNHWSFRNAGGLFYLATSSRTTFATSTVSAFSINANGFPAFPSLGGGVVLSTGGLLSASQGTNGQLLVGSTGANPAFATLNCADGLTCTTGAGTLEIDFDGTDSPQGELGNTWASPTIDDSVTVTGWALGASTADTPAVDDNDTSLATSAFVQTEIFNFKSPYWATTTGAYLGITPSAGNNVNLGIGTSTPVYTLTVASTSGPQLSLSSGVGFAQWVMRNAGGNLYFSTTTVAGTATTSSAGLALINSGKPGLSVSSSTPSGTLTVEGRAGHFNDLVYFGSSTPYLRINNSGNIFAHGLNTATNDNALCLDATTKEVEDSGGLTCALSSLKAKKDIESLKSSLEKILALNPVTFTYKENGEKHHGFIAEEVAEVDPLFAEYAQKDITLEDGAVIKEGDPRSLDDRSILASVIKAVQEIWQKVVGIDERVEKLEKENAELRERLEIIESKI